MMYLDFMTISGSATGSEGTYFDEIVTTVLKLSSRVGTDIRGPFLTMKQFSPLRFVKQKYGEFLNQSEWSLILHIYITSA